MSSGIGEGDLGVFGLGRTVTQLLEHGTWDDTIGQAFMKISAKYNLDFTSHISPTLDLAQQHATSTCQFQLICNLPSNLRSTHPIPAHACTGITS